MNKYLWNECVVRGDGESIKALAGEVRFSSSLPFWVPPGGPRATGWQSPLSKLSRLDILTWNWIPWKMLSKALVKKALKRYSVGNRVSHLSHIPFHESYLCYNEKEDGFILGLCPPQHQEPLSVYPVLRANSCFLWSLLYQTPWWLDGILLSANTAWLWKDTHLFATLSLHSPHHGPTRSGHCQWKDGLS